MVIQLYSTPFSLWYYIYLAVSEHDHPPFFTKSCGFWQTRALTEVGSVSLGENSGAWPQSPALCSGRCQYPTAVWEQDILHSQMKFTCAKPHKIYLWKKIKPNQAFIKSYKREISRYPQACRPYFNIWRPGGKWKIGQNAERISRGR